MRTSISINKQGQEAGEVVEVAVNVSLLSPRSQLKRETATRQLGKNKVGVI